MTPLPPSEPITPLAGLGVNVRLAIPGHATKRPDGRRVWLMAEDLRVEELDDGNFMLIDPELPEPVVIDRAEVVAAAAQVANLIVARRKDARTAAAVIDDAILPDSNETALARTVANAIANLEPDGRGEQ